MYAALRFKHQNKFPYQINSNIRFLSANGRSQFNVAYVIPEGPGAAASVIDTTRVLDSNEIEKMRRSIQMVVELEVVGAGKELEGELDFMSKGLFRFEF